MAPACHLGFRLSTEAFFFVNWASVLSDHGCIRTSLDIQHPSLLFRFGLCYDSVPCSSSLSHAVEACSVRRFRLSLRAEVRRLPSTGISRERSLSTRHFPWALRTSNCCAYPLTMVSPRACFHWKQYLWAGFWSMTRRRPRCELSSL